MNIVFNINEFDYNKVYFYNPIKNKVKKYENFYKIIYNCNFYTITTLIIKILDFTYSYNNGLYKIYFSPTLIQEMTIMEFEILKKIKHLNHNFVCNQDIGNVTIVTKIKPENIYLRIYGVWNKYNDIGLVYRFIY